MRGNEFTQPRVYYTAISPWGERYELECDTPEQAYDFAHEEYQQVCIDNGVTSRTSSIYLIGFLDDGEKTEIFRELVDLEFEDYHGDYTEHFSQRSFV